MTGFIFPLAAPATPSLKTYNWRPRIAASVSESPFTYDAQAQLYPGEGWGADVALPPMERPAAEPWVALGLALRGQYGTMLIGPVGKEATPRGSWAGAPLADSAGSPSINLAGATVMHLKGFTHGAAGVIKTGDFFSFNDGLETRLHKFIGLTDIAADGAGLAAIDIFPRLRAPVPNGTAITFNSPVGTFRRGDNGPGWDLGEACTYGVSFSIVEAFASPPAL